MKKTLLTFTEIPAWTYVGAEKGWYALANALSLAGLENRYVKLSAATQRAILGDERIGKQSVGIFDGQLMLGRKVCFPCWIFCGWPRSTGERRASTRRYFGG